MPKWSAHVDAAAKAAYAEEYPEGPTAATEAALSSCAGGAARTFLCGPFAALARDCSRLSPGYHWRTALRELLETNPSSAAAASSASDSLLRWQDQFGALVQRTCLELLSSGRLTDDAKDPEAAPSLVAPGTWLHDGVVFRRVEMAELASFRLAQRALEAAAACCAPHICVVPLTLCHVMGHCVAAAPLPPLEAGDVPCTGLGDEAAQSALRGLATCLSVPFSALRDAVTVRYGADGVLWVLDASGITPLLPPGIRASEGTDDDTAAAATTAAPAKPFPVALRVSALSRMRGDDAFVDSLRPVATWASWPAPAPAAAAQPRLPPLRARRGLELLLGVADEQLSADAAAAVLPRALQSFRGELGGTVCGMNSSRALPPPPPPAVLSPQSAPSPPPAAGQGGDDGVRAAQWSLGPGLRRALCDLLVASGADPAAVGQGRTLATFEDVLCERRAAVAAAAADPKADPAWPSAGLLLRRSGLPIRFCGKLWNAVLRVRDCAPEDEALQAVCERALAVLATEMVARGFKRWLRSHWLGCGSEGECCEEADRLFSNLLRNDKRRRSIEAANFFSRELLPLVASAELFGEVHEKHMILLRCDRHRVYFAVCSACGVHVQAGKAIAVHPFVRSFRLPHHVLGGPAAGQEETLQQLRGILASPSRGSPFERWPVALAVARLTATLPAEGARSGADAAVSVARKFEEAIKQYQLQQKGDAGEVVAATHFAAQLAWDMHSDAQRSAGDYTGLLDIQRAVWHTPAIGQPWRSQRHGANPGPLTSWIHAVTVMNATMYKYHSHVDADGLLQEPPADAAAALLRIKDAVSTSGVDPVHEHAPEAFALFGLGQIRSEEPGAELEAIEYFEKFKVLWGSVMGDMDQQVGICFDHIGRLRNSLGDRSAAERDLVRALNIFRAELGPSSARTASSMNNLAFLFFFSDDDTTRRRALPLFMESLDIARTASGEVSAEVATLLNNIGSVYFQVNEWRNAESTFQKSLEVSKALRPPDLESAALCEQHIRICRKRMQQHAARLLARVARGALGRSMLRKRFAAAQRDRDAAAKRASAARAAAAAAERDESAARGELVHQQLVARSELTDQRDSAVTAKRAEAQSRGAAERERVLAGEGEARAALAAEEAAARSGAAASAESGRAAATRAATDRDAAEKAAAEKAAAEKAAADRAAADKEAADRAAAERAAADKAAADAAAERAARREEAAKAFDEAERQRAERAEKRKAALVEIERKAAQELQEPEAAARKGVAESEADGRRGLELQSRADNDTATAMQRAALEDAASVMHQSVESEEARQRTRLVESRSALVAAQEALTEEGPGRAAVRADERIARGELADAGVRGRQLAQEQMRATARQALQNQALAGAGELITAEDTARAQVAAQMAEEARERGATPPQKQRGGSPRYWIDQHINIDHDATDPEQEQELLKRLRAVQARLRISRSDSPAEDPVGAPDAAAAAVSDALVVLAAERAAVTGGCAVAATLGGRRNSTPLPPLRRNSAEPTGLPPARPRGNSIRSDGLSDKPRDKRQDTRVWADVHRVSMKLERRLRKDLEAATSHQAPALRVRLDNVRRVIEVCRNIDPSLTDDVRHRTPSVDLLAMPGLHSRRAWATPPRRRSSTGSPALAAPRRRTNSLGEMPVMPHPPLQPRSGRRSSAASRLTPIR
eukprot:TRINITY_DN1628_c0_g2_i1.p1 TRINITY_DN1628_c0_g2~~TRINITY_DN1628_c0_g2_i1.p1  ORF type:complete len:1693 (+),score=441.88 TRINITY_DN1628_c0_g2_i1:73-5079(+)